MTAPDYVAQVADVIREFIVEAVGFDNGELMTAQAENLAHNLAAAGLIPTSTEWGVRYEVDRDRTLDETRASEDDARRDVEASPTDNGLISRAVTDWKDAT